MKKLIVLAIISSLVTLTACNVSNPGSSEEKPLSIITSIYPLQYFTERIGGEHVKVNTLLPPGSDAHTFEPTSKDMMSIAESNLFIYNGLGMESYSSKITKALKNEETIMLEATKGADVISSSHHHEEQSDNAHETETHDEEAQGEHSDSSLEEETHEEHSNDSQEEEAHDEHDHGDYDPHVWLDPSRANHLAANIRDALVELRPEEKETFQRNYKALQKDLDDLHHEFEEAVSGKDHPEILVSHAAYGYWEDSYGIEQLAVSGLSPTDEPSQKELKDMIETAKEHQIKYVIFEQNVTPRIAKIVQNEIKAEPLKVHNLSVLTDEDIEENKDYLSLMKENIQTIKKALENE
ncbi:MAG: metal ABC transporter solute-binding protein, Zn/Mn family [Bacillota bacterium]